MQKLRDNFTHLRKCGLLWAIMSEKWQNVNVSEFAAPLKQN